MPIPCNVLNVDNLQYWWTNFNCGLNPVLMKWFLGAFQTSRRIVSSCTSVSVDTEDTVRSVLTVLELVLEPWRQPELELLAGVTLVLELDIVTCLCNTLTVTYNPISILSRYLQIYISIWISCVVSVSESAVSSNYRPVAGTQVAAPLLGGPHTASGPAGGCCTVHCTGRCIYYLPPLQWISKTWKGHGHTEHWSSQTCLWEPTHQLQILWLDKRWCCRRKILVYQCFFKLHLFRVN